jgi:dGTPase
VSGSAGQSGPSGLPPVPQADRDLFTSWEAIEGDHGRTLHKTFDCSIMDLADDVAFRVHDLEDPLAMGPMDASDVAEMIAEAACESFLAYLKHRAPEDFGNDIHTWFVEALTSDQSTRKRTISRMVDHLITSVQVETIHAFGAGSCCEPTNGSSARAWDRC